MKTLLFERKDGAFTFLDLLIVLVTVGLVAVLYLAWVSQARARPSRINCISNLRQVGLGFRMWSNDHNDTFPWNVSTNDGGTKEYAGTTEVFRHFAIASNEFSSPRILACPVDQGRARATAFDASLNNGNVSYFVGLDSDEAKPASILSGDRTITTNGFLTAGFLTISTNSRVRWAKGLHTDVGNIAQGDGSAQQMSAVALQTFTRTNAEPPLRLILP